MTLTTSHSIITAIGSIYFVQKADSTFIYSSIVKISNTFKFKSPPIIFYLILEKSCLEYQFLLDAFHFGKMTFAFFSPRDARPVTFHQTLTDVCVNGPRSGKMCVKESRPRRTFSDAPYTYINVSVCAQLFQYSENRQKSFLITNC